MGRMKFSTALVAVACMALASGAGAQIIFSDEFDDGNPLTNALGVGSYTAQFLQPVAPVESGGIIRMPGTPDDAGNVRELFYTNEAFNPVGATPIRSTITITQMTRTTSNNNATSRFFFGITPSPLKAAWVASNLQGVGNNVDAARIDTEYLEGLWVVFHGRYTDYWNGTAIPAEMLQPNQGGLFFNAPGGTITRLGFWTWDASTFTFDTASGFPDHRIAFNMLISDMTVTLTTDATGYNLEFSSTVPGAVLPGPLTGTWAAAGVNSSLLSTSSAIWHTAGRHIQSSLDKLVIESVGGGGGGEGEGEGEGEQGKTILSNVYPPFIDEGTTVILTGPAGTDHQWMKDEVAIDGATARELIFSPVTLLDQGTYKVEYNDGTKAIQVSDPFTLIVSPEGTVPVAGFLGLLALVAACSVVGLVLVRRRAA